MPITWGDDKIWIYGHIISSNRQANLDNRQVMVQYIYGESGQPLQDIETTNNNGNFSATIPTSQEGNIRVTAHLIGEDSQSDILQLTVTSQSWTPVAIIIILMALGLASFVIFLEWGNKSKNENRLYWAIPPFFILTLLSAYIFYEYKVLTDPVSTSFFAAFFAPLGASFLINFLYQQHKKTKREGAPIGASKKRK
jgi:hypothetical protein